MGAEVTLTRSIAKGNGTAPPLGVASFEMPTEAARIFEAALEREQWLTRLGLYPIITGVAHHDMREFARGCDRLVAAFKFARATGRADAELELARRWRTIAGACAAAGVLLGLALGGALLG